MEKDEKVIIEERELPVDKYKNAKICYDYRKRTRGGFADAAFLGTLIVTAGMWILIAVIIGK